MELNKLNKLNKLNIQSCIDALAGAALNREAAFHQEIAVGLLIFAVEKSTDEEAKTRLRYLYADAGYICLQAEPGNDYKTVWRRVSTCARLFNFLTCEKVSEWITGTSTAKQIASLAAQVRALNLGSIDAVIAFVTGKPRKAREARPRSNVLAFNRRQSDRIPDAVHVATEHIRVDVAPDFTRDELSDVIAKLVAMMPAAEQRAA